MTTFELSLRLFPRMLSEESLEEIYWPVLEAMVQKSENALPYSLHERKTYALLQSQVTEQLQGPVKKPRVTPPPGKGWETERFDP